MLIDVANKGQEDCQIRVTEQMYSIFETKDVRGREVQTARRLLSTKQQRDLHQFELED
jgi:hypothetical protein